VKRARSAAALAAAAFFLSGPSVPASQKTYTWDPPVPVTAESVFFGEAPREKMPSDVPAPGDKRYPWYCLEKGSEHFLKREYDKAVVFFRAAYRVPGPSRTASGFRLAEAYQALDQNEDALDVVNEMERHDLVGPSERAQAQRLKMALLDRLRRAPAKKEEPAFTGKEWLLQLSDWRMRYVLDGMNALRRHGIPLKEPAQRYVFLLDDHFLKDPTRPASDPVRTMAAFLYDYDPDTRLPIDRWRMNPEGTVTDEAKAFDLAPNKLTGAEWITMTHEDKLEYVEQAMRVLQDQQVPMKKGVYAYVEAVDELFTAKPELPAYDPVVALASYLHEAETPAREVLEALRLR
jgi:hypothetical protein